MTDSGAPILQVRNLSVEYAMGWHRPALRAVDHVSFHIDSGETVGLVGESGSGKTTIGRAILGLTPTTSGDIYFSGTEITRAGYRQRRELSRELQAVFQDPYSSLNPARTIGQTLGETLRIERATRAETNQRILEMLERIGLPADAIHRYPAHFSGGQRQRISIARALMVQPRLIICDEPTSALDLSVQAQVLNLLRKLQREFRLSYLFISHDLPVVRHMAHRIIVLYRGRVMEFGDATTVYSSPVHPYTKALLAAAPVPDPDEQRMRRLSRHRARARNLSAISYNSCPFADRCPDAIDLCRTKRPSLETTPSGVFVACHRWRELSDGGSRTVFQVDDRTGDREQVNNHWRANSTLTELTGPQTVDGRT